MRSTGSWKVSPTTCRSRFDDDEWRLKTDAAEQPDPVQSDSLAELHRWLDARTPTSSSRSRTTSGSASTFQQPGEKGVDPGEVCALLAAILAHGCNLGLYTMEKVAPDIAYRRLKYVSDWRLVEEKRAALSAIVHGISRLDPAGHWGDGTTSAIDGQRFAMPQKVLQARASDQVVAALGALDAPAVGVAAAGDAPWVQEYTPLATVGWVESVGPAAAVDAIRVVAAGVRAGTPLADALAETVGTGTAEALLGPPASSDVLVAPAERTLEIAGRRWLWRDGGWEPAADAIHVTQRFDDDGDRRRIGPVPTTVDPGAPFTLMDAWPSFERTPTDNVWRGGGND